MRAGALDAVVAGRYVLERRLDRGGASEVWLARDRRDGTQVALKLARSAAPVWPLHPGLVRVLERGTHGGRSYTVMTLVAGRTLAAILAEGRPRPDDGRRMVAAIADAIAALHAAGMTHGDVRPANVIVGPEGSVTLLDPEDPRGIRATDDGAALASLARELGIRHAEP